jgi:hypothetical protein
MGQVGFAWVRTSWRQPSLSSACVEVSFTVAVLISWCLHYEEHIKYLRCIADVLFDALSVPSGLSGWGAEVAR